jgi:acyl-CoA hydrolase
MIQPDYKNISESETELTELMIPSYANFGGKVHGGTLLSLMDKVAYVCASKHAGAYCVTVAVDGVEFLSPVEVGELVSLKASVNYVGNTSMIIGIRVEALNPRTGIRKHTNSCYFTMAANDDEGNLLKVPGLLLETGEQLRRFCEGKYLKSLSKQKRELLKSDLSSTPKDDMLSMVTKERCQVKYFN